MRRATVTIPEELEGALESYRHDVDVPPSLAALVQVALREYLYSRGYGVSRDAPPTMYEDAPDIGEGKTASEIVSEGRR